MFSWKDYLFEQTIRGQRPLMIAKETCDVKIICGGQDFSVNKWILEGNSEYFKELFINLNANQIKIDLIPPQRMSILIRFMYHGLEEGDTSIETLEDAAKFKMNHMKKMVAKRLEKILNCDNAILMLLSAFKTNEKNLAVAAWNFMKENVVHLKRPENWERMDTNNVLMAMEFGSTFNLDEISKFLGNLALAPHFRAVSN